MANQRVAKIRGHSEHLLDLFIGLREKYALLEPIVFDKVVVARVGSGPRRRGLQIFRQTFLFSCLNDVAKLAMDSDPRTPNVTSIVSAMEEPAVKQFLREADAHWAITDDAKETPAVRAAFRAFEAEEQDRRRAKWDEWFTRLATAWAELRDSQELLHCRTMRDQFIAHSQLHHDGSGYRLLDIEALGFRWTDLKWLVERLQEVTELINLLTRSASFAFEQLDGQLGSAAAEFWKELK